MRVSVGDVSLYFDVSGPGWKLDDHGVRERPVLIGLHGGPGLDGTKHRYQLAALADTAQVIVPDQRGHGRSDPSDAEHWNLATWAADVKALGNVLGIRHPFVFGSSFGGFVAQRYASDHPGDPAGLILASTAARLPGLDELVERFREVGGDEAADVTRRDAEELTEATAAEWKRVCGPLLSLNPDPDPGVAKG
jgi:proline iminopeptidase